MFSKSSRPGAPFLFLLLASVALLLPRVAPAQTPAVLLNPANGHYYEAVAVGGGGLNWAAAKAAAEARSYLGTPGHLVTLTSAAEKQFVNSSFPAAVGNSWWLGGFQPAGSAEPSGGWQWVTGEPWSYTSWGSGEPNNSANKENALQYAGGGSGDWNDVDGTFLYGGYIAEYDVPAGPAPTAPTSLSAIAVSASRIDVTWTHPNPDSVGFKIERKQGTDNYAEIAQVSAVTSYSDTAVGPGISYVYRVRAVNGGGVSPYSPEANAATPLSGTPVLNPANGHYYLAVPGPTAGITWWDAEAAARATRFNGVSGHLATVVTAAENTFLVNNLSSAVLGHWCFGGFQVPGSAEPAGGWQWLTGEAWSYTNWNTGEPNNSSGDDDVLAYWDNGRWNDSISAILHGGYVVEFEPGWAAPNGAPGNLTATLVTTSQVTLAWTDASTNETGFHVERKTGTGPWRPLVILPLNTTTYTDNSAAANTTYIYRVRAMTPGGESGNSNEATATAAPDPIDQISFSGPTNYSVPSETGVIEVSDLDSDGKLDLIVCNGDSVSLYYGRGEGSFDRAVTTRVGAALSQAIGADVNNDGRPDIIASASNDNQVDVLINLGNRIFAAPARYTAGTNPWGVTAGDFNKDGWLDLAVPNDGSSNMCVFLNQRNGTFGSATIYAGSTTPAKIAAADFDGDGNLDLAMSNYVSANVLIYKGNGAGGFTRTVSLGVGSYPAQLVVDDFNHDGKLDIATANTFSHNISVLMGNGAGGFGAAATYPGNTYPHMMHSADLDGDGWADLVFPNNGTDYFSVLRNRGNGLFSGTRAFTSGGHNVRMLAVGDFNGDGRVDVVTGNAQEFTISVFLNTTPGPGPRPATALSATAASATAINLAWTRSQDTVSGYKVQRKSGASFVQIGLTGAAASGFSDSGLQPNTAYTYRVVAYNGGGDSLPSNEATATTQRIPPAAPSGLTATAVNSDRVDLRWNDNSSNEDGFELERALGNGAFISMGAFGSNETWYSDTSVAPNSTYTYRVRAIAGEAASDYATSAPVTTPAINLMAPSGLTATRSGLQARLSWSDIDSKLDGFVIERKVGDGDFALLATVGPGLFPYVDATLTPDTTFTYRVRARRANVYSDPSNTAAVTTPPLPPASPTGLQAAPSGQTEIDLSWTDASTNEAGFRIERSTDGTSFAPLGTRGAGQSRYADTGLAPGSTYFYRVVAFNTGGDSGPSNVAQATTAPVSPGSPSGLAVTARTQNSISLGWTAGAGATGYEVERGDGGNFTRVGAPTGTTFTDGGLQPNTSYLYRVRAVNVGGFSGYTTNVTGTTLPDPPTAPKNLRILGMGPTSIRLGWDLSPNATSYVLERKSGSSGFGMVATLDGDSGGFTNGGRMAGVTYEYRVKAINAGGESDYSSTVNAMIPAGGKLKLSTISLKFGKIAHGKSLQKALTISNKGPGPLVVSVSAAGAPFSVVLGGGFYTLRPGQSQKVNVRFAPIAVVGYNSGLTVTSTDPAAPSRLVQLSGAGK